MSAANDTAKAEARMRHAMPGTGGAPTTSDPIGDHAEEKNKSKPIPTIGSNAIFAPLPPLTWMCEGLRLAPGGVTLFAGYGDSAKSIFVQYLIMCIVTGTPIFGKFPVTKGNVLHLDYEQGVRLSRERYQRIGRGMNVELDDLPDGALRFAAFPDIYLDDGKAEEALRATVDEMPVTIIAFDSFKAGCPDTEENSSAARKPLDMLTRVCGDARSVLGIHHSRKPPQDGGRNSDPRMSIRGTGAIYDGVFGAFVLERERDDQDSPIRVHHVKERMRGRRLDTFGFRVLDVAKGSDPHWGLRVEYVEADMIKSTVTAAPRDPKFEARCAAVFGFIAGASPGGIAVTTLMAQTQKGRAAVNQCIAHLTLTGHIEVQEEKRGRTNGTYYYPASGKTEYTPPARANGIGVEASESVNNGTTNGAHADTNKLLEDV